MTMFGCASRAALRTSRRKRARARGSRTRLGAMILTATTRCIVGWTAMNTWPMPPEPMRSSSRYCPSTAPGSGSSGSTPAGSRLNSDVASKSWVWSPDGMDPFSRSGGKAANLCGRDRRMPRQYTGAPPAPKAFGTSASAGFRHRRGRRAALVMAAAEGHDGRGEEGHDDGHPEDAEARPRAVGGHEWRPSNDPGRSTPADRSGPPAYLLPTSFPRGAEWQGDRPAPGG